MSFIPRNCEKLDPFIHYTTMHNSFHCPFQINQQESTMSLFSLNAQSGTPYAQLIMVIDVCVFCQSTFEPSDHPVSPRLSKIDSLFKACSSRQDAIGEMILRNKEDILAQRTSIRYHRQCRATYGSYEHISRQRTKRKSGEAVFKSGGNGVEQVDGEFSVGSGGSADGGGGGGGDSTNSSSGDFADFEWREHCFICGLRCFPKHKSRWSLVTDPHVNKEINGENMFSKLYESARERQDHEMIARLQSVPDGDLVGVQARYHRKSNCYTKYLYSKSGSSGENVDHTPLVKCLIAEYKEQIIDNSEVFLFQTLKDRFEEIALEKNVDVSRSYVNTHLRKHMESVCPDMMFISQPPFSLLVCSSALRVDDLLRKINQLVKSGRERNHLAHASKDFEQICIPNDEELIHQAVGLIKARLRECKRLDKTEYYSSEEMSLKAQQSYVDPLLYKVVGWLSSDHFYLDKVDIGELPPDGRCLSIASDIQKLCTSHPTPKHLGLAVHMHHEYGSRHIIDDLYHLGHSVSYDELRRFLTSAATFTASQLQNSDIGSVVPQDVIHQTKGGKQV